jgi:uncharacterized protein YjlB
MRREAHAFADDGSIPNSRLPVLIYQAALEPAAGPDDYQELFAEHDWLGAWRDGIFRFHHFHSTAHEVLGIAAGTAEVMLGGPLGRRFALGAGDVVVLPAGTGHCNLGSSADLLVVGAYPNAMRWDLRLGDPAEHAEVLANIARVPIPDADPVRGGEIAWV